MQKGQIWNFEYEILGGKKLTGKAEVVLRYNKNQVVIDANDEDYDFVMVGEVVENNFFGIWRNTAPDDSYFGTFHFIIDAAGTSMTGIFTGNTHEGEISSGSWEMNLIVG